MIFETFEIREKSGSEHMRHLLDSRIRKKRISPVFDDESDVKLLIIDFGAN